LLWIIAGLEVDDPRRYGFGQSGSAGKSLQTLGLQENRVVRTIYKICSASAWREAERRGVFLGSADDLRDGFIHFSTSPQVAETARKHFSGQAGLFLIAVDADALGDSLRWEPSRNDESFPHLYGELDLGAVTDVIELRTRSDGGHDIPELKS
jgi:uncharacterized protein (DUF952 family)